MFVKALGKNTGILAYCNKSVRFANLNGCKRIGMYKSTLLLLLFFPFGMYAQNVPIATPTNGEKANKELKGEALFLEGMTSYLAEDYETAIEKFKAISSITEPTAGVFFMLAKANSKAGNSIIALEATINGLNKNPKHAELLQLQGDIYRKELRMDDALSSYKKALELQDNNLELYISLAEVYLELNDLNGAISVYDQVEKQLGVSEEITKQKQNLYLRQNKVAKALDEGSKLIDAEPQDLGFVVDQAKLMLQNGRIKDAKKLLEEQTGKQPRFAEGWVILSEIYRQENDLKASFAAMQKAFEMETFKIETKLRILSSYMDLVKQGAEGMDLDYLEGLCKKTIAIDPEEAAPYVYLGDIYTRKGNLSQARDAYLKSLEMDKSVYNVWLAVIELDSKLGDNKLLKEHAEWATEYFPNQSFFWYHFGLASLLLNQPEDALYALDEAALLSFSNPELLQNIYTLQGDAHGLMGAWETAAKAYEQALKVDENSLGALNNYSYMLASRNKNLDLANALSTKLVALDASKADYLDTRAWVLSKQGKNQEALDLLKKAVLLEDATGKIFERLGDISYKLGKTADALYAWKTAKEKGAYSALLEEKIKNQKYIE